MRIKILVYAESQQPLVTVSNGSKYNMFVLFEQFVLRNKSGKDKILAPLLLVSD